MSRVFWKIVALAIVGYFAVAYNTSMDQGAADEAKRAELEKVEEAEQETLRASIRQMASRTGAIDNWEQELSGGEAFRSEPILTIELEKLWLQGQPILFMGYIKDIATHDQSNYLVLVERGFFGITSKLLQPGLQLALISKKETIDSFLENYPDTLKPPVFGSVIAVVAQINAIRTIERFEIEGETHAIKRADGELVDIAYARDVRL